MRRCVLLTTILILGCRPDEELTPLVTVIDASAPESAALAAVVGIEEIEVPVRLLNRYDASIQGSDLELSLSGTTASAASTTVSLDPTGYGTLEVSVEEPEAFTVGLDSSGDSVVLGDSVECWAVADALPAWDLRPSWMLPAELGEVTETEPLLEGVVLATELEVWFLGIEPDAQLHRVLTMPDPILELEAVHIDNDGVTDLLVRSVDELVLLRGRPGGGMAWGAGFAAEGLELVGASVDDVDGDTRNDVGFALQGTEGAWLVIMGGDGAWGFEEIEELRFALDYAVVDIELSQSDADGQAEVALLKSDSVLMRYYWSADGDAWAETYPSTLETHLASPASFLGAADLNGLGADEPILLSHASAGVQQSVIFYTLDGDTIQYQKSYQDPFWSLADLSADLMPDIVSLEGGELHIIHFATDEGGADFAYHTIGGVYIHTGTDADDDPETGPIAAGLLDGDRLPDLTMVTDALHLFPGQEVETAWAAIDGRWSSYDLQLLAEPALADLDEEPGIEAMAGWVTSYSVPVLRTWSIDPDPHGELPTLNRHGEILFEDSAEPLDVAITTERVFGLVDFDGTQLVAMTRDDGETWEELGRVAVDGAALVTGSFADDAVLAVISAEGEVSWRDADMVELGTDSLGAYGCVVAADSDGDGLHELHTGTDAGCELLAVDLDGDGTDEIASASAEGISVDWAGVTHSLEGTGRLAARDLDGDGQPELLAASGGRIWLYRAVGEAFVPGSGLHGATVLGSIDLGDVTGDGLDDIITTDSDGIWRILWGVD